MIDCIIPANPRNAAHVALHTIPELADSTDIPVRFIVSARGGLKTDWDVVRQSLNSLRDQEGLHYGIMMRERMLGSPAVAVDAVANPRTGLIKHEYVLVLRPEISISDKDWFSKMVAPLQKAPYVGGVFLPAEPSGSSTLVPNSLNENNRIYETSGFLTTKTHLEMVGGNPIVPSVRNYDEFFQMALVSAGAVRWMHSGVRFRVDYGATWDQ
jgi:hypothetical protein